MYPETTSLNISFYIRRTRPNKHGEVPVCVRITVNGQRTDTTIHKSIRPELWDAKRSRASSRTALGKNLNLYLENVRARLVFVHRELEFEQRHYTVHDVLERFLGRCTSNRRTLLKLFREHNEKCRQLVGIDMAEATAGRYDTCLKHTLAFIRHTYRRDDIELERVDRRFIEDFGFFLKTSCGCSHNTTMKYLGNFKKIIRLALSRKWMEEDPFAGMRFKMQPVRREMPEKAEIDRILHKEITIPRLALTRDIFIFCCFTGLAFSDIKELAPEHLATDMQGHR